METLIDLLHTAGPSLTFAAAVINLASGLIAKSARQRRNRRPKR